jgi:hypothetical protein
LRPKIGRRESERLYKGRNPSSWGTPPPTNLQPPEPRFRLPHGSHLHGGGLWCGTVCDVNHHLVGNPKRKLWWVQQQAFPSVRNQGLIVSRKKSNSRRWCLLA